jgi:hypothetical protein
MRKFYKTVFEITVLSEYPISENVSLSRLEKEMCDGDFSGQTEMILNKELTAKEAAVELIGQNSDPGFFGLDEDGNEAT